MKRKSYMVVIAGICILAVGIGGLWARSFAVVQTTVSVQEAAGEAEIPEEYEFIDGITENNGVDPYYVSLCNASLQILPEWLLKKFEDSGWTITVTEEDINEAYLNSRYSEGDGSVNGATVYSLQEIVITQTTQAASTAPVHEMGHWFDYITSGEDYSFSSESEEFASLYEEEADTFISVFGIANPDTSNKQELCADLFKYYWEDPGKLERKCPGLYGWMDSLVAEADALFSAE